MTLPTPSCDPHQRIVCLTEEPTEILYLLGEQERVVGISAYTVRPPEAARDKPKVSAFSSGSVAKIKALRPDLVIGFSDVQAKLAAELISEGLQVVIYNQRSLSDILNVVVSIGRLVGAETRAQDCVRGLVSLLSAAQERASRRASRPRVYFEEWPEPQITGLEWISELVTLVGGCDVFAGRSHGSKAEQRVVSPEEVVLQQPDVVLASWCGKPFDAQAFAARPGFAELPAVRSGRIYEVDPAIILQPGPAAILAGLPELERLIHSPPR